jgi:hypothetical protein
VKLDCTVDAILKIINSRGMEQTTASDLLLTEGVNKVDIPSMPIVIMLLHKLAVSSGQVTRKRVCKDFHNSILSSSFNGSLPSFGSFRTIPYVRQLSLS